MRLRDEEYDASSPLELFRANEAINAAKRRRVADMLSKEPALQVPAPSDDDERRAREHASLLRRVGRVESITVLAPNSEAPGAATALLDDLRLLVPMAGLIDVDAERQRLGKLRDKVRTDLDRSQGKLGNERFVNNAPEQVVTQERERVAEFERQLANIGEQLEKLDAFG